MVQIKQVLNQFKLQIDGEDFYIKGVGGTYNLEYAKSLGANSFKTWNEDNIDFYLKKAKDLDLKVMVTFELKKGKYLSEDSEYQKTKFDLIIKIVEEYKDNDNILFWNLGNEINIDLVSDKSWIYLNKIANIIHSIDKNHPVSTVIAWADKVALNSIAEYCPSIDAVGINAYAGYFSGLIKNYEESKYRGPILLTEWGTLGHWEAGKTYWNAPIEPTGMEKLQYFAEYYDYIIKNDIYLGSYVFLWGQKQEITPTWYSMFSEISEIKSISDKPLSVALLMRYLWNSESYDLNLFFDIKGIIINGKRPRDNLILKVTDDLYISIQLNGNYKYFKVYLELMNEESVRHKGGGYAERPKTLGDMLQVDFTQLCLNPITIPGKYRLFVYVVNEKGELGVANFPFYVEE